MAQRFLLQRAWAAFRAWAERWRGVIASRAARAFLAFLRAAAALAGVLARPIAAAARERSRLITLGSISRVDCTCRCIPTFGSIEDMAKVNLIVETIGPWSGRWRVARKPFQCMHRIVIGETPQPCGRTVCVGERYYDTCEGVGLGSYFNTLRICAGCARVEE